MDEILLEQWNRRVEFAGGGVFLYFYDQIFQMLQ